MSSVDDWEDAGLVEVLLPSGRRVRGKLPDLVDLARRDMIPEGLLAWVLKAADPEWLADPTPDPELDARVQGYLDQLVVLFLKQVMADDQWVDKTLDAARLDRLPAGERYTLELVVAYRLTPQQASARSLMLIEGEELPDEEGETGVDRLLPFREGDDGPPAGQDGEDLGDDPVPVSRPPRRRRVSGRRGAGDTPDDRRATGGVRPVADAAG